MSNLFQVSTGQVEPEENVEQVVGDGELLPVPAGQETAPEAPESTLPELAPELVSGEIVLPNPPTPASNNPFARFRRAIGIRNAAEREAQARYRRLAFAAADQGLEHPDALEQSLGSLAAAAGLTERKLDAIRVEAFGRFTTRVVADHILTEQEEAEIQQFADLLGIGDDLVQSRAKPQIVAIQVARANAGRLDPLDTHEMMTKDDELVYYEAVGTLLKEVTIKEYRGGYSGVSYKVSKNVRINTGGTRGRLGEVGTQIVPEDVGILSITNARAVFMGSKKTLEFRFDKLVGARLFEDAITLQVSNRQTPAVIQFDQPQLVAAVLNAAASKSS